MLGDTSGCAGSPGRYGVPGACGGENYVGRPRLADAAALKLVVDRLAALLQLAGAELNVDALAGLGGPDDLCDRLFARL